MHLIQHLIHVQVKHVFDYVNHFQMSPSTSLQHVIVVIPMTQNSATSLATLTGSPQIHLWSGLIRVQESSGEIEVS